MYRIYMAINWNMDIRSLGALFKKKGASLHAPGFLVLTTKKIWRFSVIFLAVFAILIVAYDAYIFWEYVYNQQEVDIGGQGSVESVGRASFDSVAKTIDERSVQFERAKLADPIRNPFKK